MLKDRVIELKDGVGYYVFEETELNGKKYILAAVCDVEKDEINEDEFVVKEVGFVNGGLVTRSIDNDNLAVNVTKTLIEKFRK